MKKKKGKSLGWLVAAVLLLIAVAVLVLGIWMPYRNAESRLPEGEFIIRQQEGGELELSWPEAPGADSYCLEILTPAGPWAAEKSVYRSYVNENKCILPQLPQGLELTIRVQSVGEYRIFGSEYIRMGEGVLSVTSVFDAPLIRDQIWDMDTDTKTATVNFTLAPGDRCQCYLVRPDGSEELLRDMTQAPLTLHFGENGDLPIPEYGETIDLDFYGYRELPGLKFYGVRSIRASVERDMLLGRSMDVTAEEIGGNAFTLTWNEAKGETYEVQLYDSAHRTWKGIAQLPCEGERTFTTPRLPAGRDIRCRIVTQGGDALPGSHYTAVSEEITLTTEISPIYATVWPTRDLQAFRNPDLSDAAGTVKVATALCVLEETGNAFAVRVDGEILYIDSRYCMINLPEYMGSLCSYNITNSYSSKYMIHELGIPQVTGEVTKGYEHVSQADGSFLVPLLYPTAKKLVRAAELAAEEGFRLKIYDAFRPNRATQDIYNLTSYIMDDPIPDSAYNGASLDSLDLPPLPEEEPYLTYRMVMTLGSYELGSFLAPGVSYHNLGVAMDLTMEDLETGEEIPMQSAIHDLSAYSVVTKNTEAGKALAKIMGGAGFSPLFSEWWHFQDNENRMSLGLTSIYPGVSAEGWVADDEGWRFRSGGGEFYTGRVSIGGVEYSFDENGYVLE